MAETSGISSSFWKSLITVAAIVAGTFYIDNSMKSSMKEVLAPYVERAAEMKKTLELHSVDLNALKTKSDLNDYKWNIYENQIRSFIKPDEIDYSSIKNRHRR